MTYLFQEFSTVLRIIIDVETQYFMLNNNYKYFIQGRKVLPYSTFDFVVLRPCHTKRDIPPFSAWLKKKFHSNIKTDRPQRPKHVIIIFNRKLYATTVCFGKRLLQCGCRVHTLACTYTLLLPKCFPGNFVGLAT